MAAVPRSSRRYRLRRLPVLAFVAAALATACVSTSEDWAWEQGPDASVAAAAGRDDAPPPPSVPEPPAAEPASEEPMGTSCSDLVPIDADNESDGVDAEYEWLRRHYPGFHREEQMLGECNDETPVDGIVIVTSDGVRRRVLFDISKFFGRR